MKKIVKFMFLAIAGLLLSCSTDDNQSSNSNVQTSSVVFSIDQPATVTTGKQIKRKNIPVWVKEIKIVATSNVWSGYSVNDNFTFDEQNGADFITLNNVSTGSTTFTATTQTDSPQFYQLTNYTTNAGSASDRFEAALNNINKENPYVLYTGTKTETIAQTGANTVAIPMITENGRLLTVFQLKQNLKDLGLQAKITASIPGGQSLVAITKGNELVTFKWSDTKSLANTEVTYKVEISSINAQQTILETYNITQKVIASTSLSCFYELDFKNYQLTRNDVKITLNWQEWVNSHCTDCNI